MFKTKLMLAIAAIGFSAAASANIDGSTANGEFVFSAFDRDSGVGYTYELSDIGFGSLFGSDVRMNSLVGSTNTTSSVGFTLLQKPDGSVVFDAVLPSFGDFLTGAVQADVVWNITSIDTSGLRRLVQTVDVAPTGTYTAADLNATNNVLNGYFGAVNGKIGLGSGTDGHALTVEADFTAYAGAYGQDFSGFGYDSFGALDQEMGMYVFGGTSSSSSSNAASLMEQIVGIQGNALTAKVYMADDGMYHLTLAVPEPSTYAMLLAGLGLLGFAARRNKRA